QDREHLVGGFAARADDVDVAEAPLVFGVALGERRHGVRRRAPRAGLLAVSHGARRGRLRGDVLLRADPRVRGEGLLPVARRVCARSGVLGSRTSHFLLWDESASTLAPSSLQPSMAQLSGKFPLNQFVSTSTRRTVPGAPRRTMTQSRGGFAASSQSFGWRLR